MFHKVLQATCRIFSRLNWQGVRVVIELLCLDRKLRRATTLLMLGHGLRSYVLVLKLKGR